MWIIAGILLGLVVLAALVGFHSGPHAHVAAGAIGVLAAAWLVVMAVEGRSDPALWALLSADVVVSGGVGIMAWKGFQTQKALAGRPRGSVEGSEGVALTDLTPEGIVRIRGEQWSAVSVNGTVRAGQVVHVLRSGVKLEVWGEDVEAVSTPDVFTLGEAESTEPSQ